MKASVAAVVLALLFGVHAFAEYEVPRWDYTYASLDNQYVVGYSLPVYRPSDSGDFFQFEATVTCSDPDTLYLSLPSSFDPDDGFEVKETADGLFTSVVVEIDRAPLFVVDARLVDSHFAAVAIPGIAYRLMGSVLLSMRVSVTNRKLVKELAFPSSARFLLHTFEYDWEECSK